MYNTNGKNVYTSKATVPVTIILMTCILGIALKYLVPMFSDSPFESSFEIQPLSNPIGLTSNKSFEDINFWDKDYMWYKWIVTKRIKLPKFNYEEF